MTTVTTGDDTDPDGYLLRLDGQPAGRIDPNAVVTIPDVATGDRQLELAESTANCVLDGDNPRTVSVAAGAAIEVTFALSCTRVGGRIAFDSDRDGNPEIYVMNVDGSGLRRLTNHPGVDQNPRWSPDGTKIAFWSDRTGARDIYVMNADGSNLTNLTNSPSNDRNPDWSPDGARLAFTSDRDGGFEIYVMSTDGSNPVRQTDLPGDNEWPSWSPDGSRIAFHNTLFDPTVIVSIHAVDVDGGSLQALTNGPAEIQPAWSPDGSRIVFARPNSDDLGFVGPDGGMQGISVGQNHPRAPTWSPDGVKIAYEEGEDAGEIIALFEDGSGRMNLTNHPAHDARPDWGPE